MPESIKNYPSYQFPVQDPYNKSVAMPKDFSYRQATSISSGTLISLTTSEGDIVSISGSSIQKHALTATKEENKASASIFKEQRTVQSEESLVMQVTGDLNEKELADITHIMKDLKAVAKAFFNGDMDKAISKAADIDNFESLSTLSATFSYNVFYNSAMTANTLMPSADKIDDNLLFSALPENEDTYLSHTSLLEAQWQQILEHLSQMEEKDLPSLKRDEGKNVMKEDLDLIVQRMGTMLSRNPRLTPHVPQLAHQAILSQPLSTEGSNASADQFLSSFTDAFRRWALLA